MLTFLTTCFDCCQSVPSRLELGTAQYTTTCKMLSRCISCPTGPDRICTGHLTYRSHHRVAVRALPTTQRSDTSLQAELLQKLQDRRWGASDTVQERQQVLEITEQLSDNFQTSIASTSSSSSGRSSSSTASTNQQPAACCPTEGALAGDWQLLWTTEAAVHKLVKGQLLGVPVTDIQQQIDLSNKRVHNKICFGLLGLQLMASGPLTVLNTTRIYYSFDQIMLGLLRIQLKLPLFIKGGGWTDCVYLDERTDVRIMRNSRQDTLILSRLP